MCKKLLAVCAASSSLKKQNMRKTNGMAKFDGVFQLDERGFQGGEKLRNGELWS